MTREQLLSVLAHRISAVERTHPVRVAIDGVDAAGKTTLADEPGRAEDVIVINDDVAFPSMNERRGL